MKVKLLVFIALMILTQACSTIKKTAHNAVDVRINNIAWGVVSFKGKTLNSADFPNGLPAIIFNMQDDKINGSDGCNNFMGVATYKRNAIKIGPIASTKMACQGTDIQTDFYTILASDNLTWRFDNDGYLRLLVNDAEVMALREKQ
jgi:heat shock protein HslJ